MRLAYVDTSCIIAVAFGEPDAGRVAALLGRFDRLFSSNLLEAEFRAAQVREGATNDISMLGAITWVIPERPLSAEIARVLAVGPLKGADTWHLACALSLDPSARELSFVTLDDRQGDVARKIGFTVRPSPRHR